MSFISYSILKELGKAYGLHNSTDYQMFDDLWEVYQVGNKTRRKLEGNKESENILQQEVNKAYDELTKIIKKDPCPSKNFNRVKTTNDSKLVVFSDLHINHTANRHDYFKRYNYKLYLTLLDHYADKGFSLVENGDIEDLVLHEPTPPGARTRRNLVQKDSTLGIKEDIGTIDWQEFTQIRVEQRVQDLQRIFDENASYYTKIKEKFGRDRYHKLTGNHDTFLAPRLIGLIEQQYWPGVINDLLLVNRTIQREDHSRPLSHTYFAIAHGHQFDQACNQAHASQIGETITECLGWGFQGPDRIWELSDTNKWSGYNNTPLRPFNNKLTKIPSDKKKMEEAAKIIAEFAVTSGATNVPIALAQLITNKEAMAFLLDAFMGHEVAWEYFEERNPASAFIKEVCSGEEFFKYRHTDEDRLANYMLNHWGTVEVFPTLICGHTHEPRIRSTFVNPNTLRTTPDTNNPLVFTKYLNSGSAGRFENLIWCVEIIDENPCIVSWSNMEYLNSRAQPSLSNLQKVVWNSNEIGEMVGTIVPIT